MKRMTAVALVFSLTWALYACGGDADAPQAGSGPASGTSEEGGSAAASVPVSGEEAAEAYVEGLMELVDLARGVQDEESAREIAPEFEQKASELSEIGRRVGEMSAIQQAQLAREHEQITRLTAQLGAEMTRIATDPELAEAMSNALRAYRAQ